jgi:hypothetical protein
VKKEIIGVKGFLSLNNGLEGALFGASETESGGDSAAISGVSLETESGGDPAAISGVFRIRASNSSLEGCLSGVGDVVAIEKPLNIFRRNITQIF